MGWLQRRRDAASAELAAFRDRSTYLREDVTVFGEQLSELHVDTLTAELTATSRDHYQRALESYERAKERLTVADRMSALDPVSAALVEGRFHRACVLAAAAGEPEPERLPECFFNPQHGPSITTVRWTPPGGTERVVAVCRSDANRLTTGLQPAVRMVRVGEHWVPWLGGPGPSPERVDHTRVVGHRRELWAWAWTHDSLPPKRDRRGDVR